MKKYLLEFFKRGLIFGGFGPIILGIIYYIISLYEEVNLSGLEVLIAIISIYLLAFIQAGASVFNSIEEWSILKSVAFHLSFIYLAYLGCYLVNSWIPFNWVVILIFTLIFLLTYFVIWFTVYFIIKSTTKKLNSKLM